MRWICESLEKIGIQVPEMNAIGGGSTSPPWTQIVTDVTGRRLKIVEHPWKLEQWVPR